MAEIPTNSNPVSEKSYQPFESSGAESRESQVAKTALGVAKSENTSSVQDLELQLLRWQREEGSKGNRKGAKNAFWQILGAYLRPDLSLFLSGFGIASVPNTVRSMTWLRQLDLSNNTLEAVPPEVWTLTNLQCLLLDNNQLRFLSPKVSGLSKLRVLNLKDNPDLKGLPWQLANLSELVDLRVGGTKVPLEHLNAITEALLGFQHQIFILDRQPEYLQLWEKYSNAEPTLTELRGQLPGPEQTAFSSLLDDFNKKYEFSTALEKIHIELQSRHCVEPVRKSARNVPDSGEE